MNVQEVIAVNTLVSCGSMISFVWMQLFVGHTYTESVRTLYCCRAAFSLDYFLS